MMNQTRKSRILARWLTALSALVAGCGGGGGSTLVDPPATTFNSLQVSPTAARVCLADSGNSVALEATAYDQSGQVMSGVGGPSFTSSEVGVATVASNGLVRAIAAGTTRITASLTATGTTRDASASITVASAVVGDAAGSILDNHELPHIALISAARLAAGDAMNLSVKGDALHSHSLSLTATQVRMIAAGCRVAQASSQDTHSSGTGLHGHTVTFN